MDAWAGSFSWQGYALEGRPDLLNYLYRGDVTWEQLWELYRSQPVSPEVVLKVSRLLHASMAADYQRAGCHLDEDGGPYRELRAWSRFAVERPDLVPEERVQEQLCRLAEDGLIDDLYFGAAYRVFMDATLERLTDGWRGELPDEEPAELPPIVERRLPAYSPELDRLPEPARSPEWQQRAQKIAAGHYPSWNRAFAGICATEDDFPDVGGEG